MPLNGTPTRRGRRPDAVVALLQPAPALWGRWRRPRPHPTSAVVPGALPPVPAPGMGRGSGLWPGLHSATGPASRLFLGLLLAMGAVLLCSAAEPAQAAQRAQVAQSDQPVTSSGSFTAQRAFATSATSVTSASVATAIPASPITDTERGRTRADAVAYDDTGGSGSGSSCRAPVPQDDTQVPSTPAPTKPPHGQPSLTEPCPEPESHAVLRAACTAPQLTDTDPAPAPTPVGLSILRV